MCEYPRWLCIYMEASQGWHPYGSWHIRGLWLMILGRKPCGDSVWFRSCGKRFEWVNNVPTFHIRQFIWVQWLLNALVSHFQRQISDNQSVCNPLTFDNRSSSSSSPSITMSVSNSSSDAIIFTFTCSAHRNHQSQFECGQLRSKVWPYHYLEVYC